MVSLGDSYEDARLFFRNTLKGAVYITGFGSKMQYMDVAAAVKDAEQVLTDAKEGADALWGENQWAICFGGDQYDGECTTAAMSSTSLINVCTLCYNRSLADVTAVSTGKRPDVGYLVHELRQRHGFLVVAITNVHVQNKWGGVDKHVDAVYYYDNERLPNGKIAWGGVTDGNPVGATAVVFDQLQDAVDLRVRALTLDILTRSRSCSPVPAAHPCLHSESTRRGIYRSGKSAPRSADNLSADGGAGSDACL